MTKTIVPLATDSVPAIERSARRIESLAALTEWQQDLTRRLARYQLKFHFVDCFSPEYYALCDELDEFRTAKAAFEAGLPPKVRP
jgi:hypothetical protein